MNRISFDPRLPQRIEATAEYLNLLNIRLNEIYRAIAAQINNGADGFLSAVVTVTADYTVLENDQVILVDTTLGNVAITLPAATDTENKVFTVKKKTSDGNTVTVDPASGNVDGSATKAWTTALATFRFASDGANYWIL